MVYNLNMRGFHCVLISSVIVSSAAVRLEECVSDEVDVVENSASLTLTCSQYTGTVTWSYVYSGRTVIVGECNSKSCTTRAGLPPYYTLTHVSGSSSRLTVTVTTRDFSGISYGCGQTGGGPGDSCTAIVVVPAVLSTAAVAFTRADSGWTIQGSSDVTTVYSSVGRYSCQWFHRIVTGQESTIAGSLTLSPDPSDTSNTQNRSGRCTFSTTFPISPGTHNYTVLVSPGNTDSNGIIQIATPSAPTVSCSPSQYVPENTDVSCTCNTQNVGQPEGRLTWFSGSIINSGNYGDRTLEMTPQNITRAGGDVQLRCDVDWATRITGQTHNATVGYIDKPTLAVSSVEVSENMTVTFTCRADDARPTPYLTLANRDSGTVLTKQSSLLSHSVSRARCEDAGVYTCTASNGMGPDTMDDVTLRVKCTPRAVRGHSDERPSVNFKGRLASLSFNMTAYPTPESFNFTFLGPNITTATTSPVGIALNASCQQKTGSLFLVTCTITVDNVTSTAAGLYRVTLINKQGHGDFIFEVKVNATEKIITDPEDEPSTQNIGAIVGGIVAAVFVAVVAVVVVLFLRRRKDPERRKLGDGNELGSDNLTGETSALGDVGKFEEQDVVTKDLYAVVTKPKMSSAETSADQPKTATYGVVNKNKPSSKPPTSGDSGANICPPASKSNPKKEKGTKRKAVNKERTEHEYGNITLSMAPAGSSVVDTGKKAEKETKKSAGGAAARQANQDGLLYTMVDFSGQGQQSTKPATPPDQQGVVYSDVLFNQSVFKQ